MICQRTSSIIQMSTANTSFLTAKYCQKRGNQNFSISDNSIFHLALLPMPPGSDKIKYPHESQ
jgi:hypothetical protein